MTSSIVFEILFIISVILIWTMLVYQFILTVAGFLYSQESAKEKRLIDKMEGELPGVSILVPAHNEELVIEHTVETLFSSDYPNDRLEIIILDDASTDRTGEILDSLAAKYSMLRVIHRKKPEGGRGKAAALNSAIPLAKFDLLAVFDADNIPEPRSLKYLAMQFVLDPNLGGALGKFRTLNKKKNLLTRFINIEGLSFQWIVQAGRWKLLKIATLPGTNLIVRRTVLNEVGYWDEEALTEDAELSFRILEAGYRIKFVPYAVTWEQEPETLAVWFKQRTRWARGNFYLMKKFLSTIKQAKNKALGFEMFYFLLLYYVFVGALLTSMLLFLSCLFGMIFIEVPGPFLEVWLLAYLLFVTEIMVMLTREHHEDSISNILLTMTTYFTYSQLWPIVVANAFWKEYVKKEKHVWVKTKRYKQEIQS